VSWCCTKIHHFYPIFTSPQQHALKTKLSTSKKTRKTHWLDYSEEKYGATIVSDTKRVLRVLALLPPLIIVATLYFQQASRWVFQSRQMNGTIGNYDVKPDQVPLVNAVSVVIFVPMCEYVFNPLMAKVKITKNLHRVIVGGVISASAFVVAAVVQFQVERRDPFALHMVWQVPQHMLLALGEWEVFFCFWFELVRGENEDGLVWFKVNRLGQCSLKRGLSWPSCGRSFFVMA
jgi:hypothetical protein